MLSLRSMILLMSWLFIEVYEISSMNFYKENLTIYGYKNGILLKIYCRVNKTKTFHLKIFIWKKDKTRRSMPCVYLGSSLNIYKIKKYFEKEISNLDTWPWDDVTVLFQLLFTKENKWYLKRKLTRRI